MNELIIKEYVNKLTEEDIKKYANKQDIYLNDDEVKIVYLYAKNYWKEFYYNNPLDLIDELKEKLTQENFNKLLNLYIKIKGI